ncbi:MAG: nucleoside hydrolase [Deferribacterota bacterium]|nr:nucleoside hydrolase [Deferribacterota bacterium]
MNYIIDTDGGIDDIFALAYAFDKKRNNIKAITTTIGNIEVEQAIFNVRFFLDLFNINFENIFIGASHSLTPFIVERAEKIHGLDGFANIVGRYNKSKIDSYYAKPSAPHYIIKCAKELKEELTIITLGPLTNIAISYVLDPYSMGSINKIVSMGGAIYSKGNYNGYAEFNVGYDPNAFYIILKSGIPLELVSLDITRKISLSSEDFCLGSKNIFYEAAKFYEKKTKGSLYLHDPLAVYLTFSNNKYTKKLDIDIELFDKNKRGLITQAISSMKNSSIIYHYDANFNEFREKLINSIKNYLS